MLLITTPPSSTATVPPKRRMVPVREAEFSTSSVTTLPPAPTI